MIELLEEEKNDLLTYYKSYVIDEQDSRPKFTFD